MREYSDYVAITRGYLRNYNRFRVTITNLTDELNELKTELDAIDARGVCYGEKIGIGCNELNAIESAVDKRMRYTDRINELERNISSIQSVVNKLDRVFAIMQSDDLDLIKAFYMERKSWKQIACEYYISEKWGRQKASKLVKEISNMLFGISQVPEQVQLFSFILDDKQLTNH